MRLLKIQPALLVLTAIHEPPGHGRVVAVHSIVTETTTRVHAEAAIRASEARFALSLPPEPTSSTG